MNKKHYHRVHSWINYWYGNATKCDNKGCTYKNPKRYEWALIKGKKYEKNIKNFKQLCPSCHRIEDYTDEQRINISKSCKGRKVHNKGYDSRENKECIVCNSSYKSYNKKSTCCGKKCRDVLNIKRLEKYKYKTNEQLKNRYEQTSKEIL